MAVLASGGFVFYVMVNVETSAGYWGREDCPKCQEPGFFVISKVI